MRLITIILGLFIFSISFGQYDNDITCDVSTGEDLANSINYNNGRIDTLVEKTVGITPDSILIDTNIAAAKLTINGGYISNNDQRGISISGAYSYTTSHHPLQINSLHYLDTDKSVATFDAYNSTEGSNNHGHMAGFQSRMIHNSTGTIDNMYGNFFQHTQNGGVVDKMYGTYIAEYDGDSSVTNNYGLYIASLTKADTNYNIYSAGSGYNFLNGNVGIATLDFSEALNVDGFVASTQGIKQSGAQFYLKDSDDDNIFFITSGGLLEMDTTLKLSAAEYISGDGDLEGIRVDGTGQVSIAQGLAASFTPPSMLYVKEPTISSDVDVITLAAASAGVGDEIRLKYNMINSSYDLGYIGMAFDSDATDSYMSFAVRESGSLNEAMKLDSVKLEVKGDIILNIHTDDVSNPPTDAELDAIFGTPAAVGAGYCAYIDDNGSGVSVYRVVSTGSVWAVYTAVIAL